MKSNRLRQTAALVLALVLVLSLCPISAIAANSELVATYDYDQNAYFMDRTKQQIALNYSQVYYPNNTSYVDANKASYYSVQPSLTAPYEAGRLNFDTLSVMQSIINYYRWLVGAGSLRKDCASSEDLQVASLVRNFDFAHIVSDVYRPSDMSWAMWEQGKNAEHNMISKYSTPMKTIADWLNEGYNSRTESWDDILVGHRSLILDSAISGLDFGYCGNCCVGKFTELNGTTNLPFLSYPAAGYMPLNDLPSQTSAWSIQLNQKMLTYSGADKLAVTVKDMKTGASYTCTAANKKLKISDLANGMSAIVFEQPATPGKYYYSNGARYSVTVTGLKDIGTGYQAVLHYTTEMFDIFDYVRSTVAKVEPMSFNTVTVYQKNATPELLNAVATVLPTMASVTAKTGFTATLPITSDGWSYDATNKVYRAKVDEKYLPSILTDPDNILRDVQLKLIIDADEKMQNNRVEVPEIIENGSRAEVKIWRYYNNLEHSRIYQITDTGIQKKFDSKEDVYYETAGTAYHTFVIDAVSHTDEGKYFGIYFSDYSQFKEAFVTDCKPMQVVNGTPVGLMIESLPDKLVYRKGESVSLDGMVLQVLYEDGSMARLTNYSGFTIRIIDHSEYDSTVEITYGGFTVSFDIVYSSELLDYIFISKLPDRLSYEIGDRALDLTGGELTVYRAGKEPQTVPMTQAVASGFDSSKLGENLITLTYQGLEITFSVRITEKHYTILWNVDGQTYTTSVEAGAMPEFIGTPSKPSDRIYEYIFIGWDKELRPATEDAEYTACFSRAVHEDCAANIFPDVDIDAWYCYPVLRAVALGLFAGYGDGSFAPKDAMTRAMLVTVLWSIEGNPEPKQTSGFVDVKSSDWYGKAVYWAYENQIVSGVGEGKFAPNTKVTREQLAAILYKYSGGRGAQGSVDNLNAYPDAAKVSSWARTAFAWAVENKILSGVASGNKIYLSPLNSASRAEVATVLTSYLTNFANIA